MPRREVKTYVTAETADYKKGLKEAEQATSKLHDALDRFGPIGNAVATVLGKLGFNSLKVAAGMGVAGAAVGVVATVVTKAINKYVELGTAVEHYVQLSGESAEVASRQLIAFQELGVDTDTAAAGMFKLAKAVEGSSDKLKELGIEVAHNQDGTTDLNGTLLNVIEAYQTTGDAVKRDQIILTAFGKAGAAMIPVLQEDAGRLKLLEESVQTTFTAQDLAAIRNYKIAQDQLGQSADDLWMSIGRIALPVLKGAVDGLNEWIYVSEHFSEKQQELAQTEGEWAVTTEEVDLALRKEFQATLNLADAKIKLKDDLEAATKAAKAQADAELKLYDQIQASISGEFAYRQAIIDRDAIRKESLKKGDDARQLELQWEQAYTKVADAAVAKANEEARGTLTAIDKKRIWITTLQDEMKTLDPKSQLYQNLKRYVDELNEIPATVTTTIAFRGVNASTGGSAHGNLSFDEGGTVPGPPGSVQMVQARGGEEFMGYGSGRKSSGGDIHIHMHGMVIDGPAMDRFFREGLRRARTVPGT